MRSTDSKCLAWDDYEGDADEIMEDRYFIDTMSIDVYPKLPNGMYQFSL